MNTQKQNKEIRAVQVFYSDRMSVTDNASYSPSAGKPRLAVESWKQLDVALEIKKPQPLDREALALAHAASSARRIVSRLACALVES